MSKKVMIGVPTYNGLVEISSAMAVMMCGMGDEVSIQYSKISLLAYNFNKLLTLALNEGFEHFCLLHADVTPRMRGWLRRMIDIMNEREYKVMSLVLPITSDGKTTSTALDAIPMPRKIMMNELPQLPQTFGRKEVKKVFGNDKLLINTGCMVIDLKGFNPRKTYFEINDSIVQMADGQYDARNMPEDWNFSKMLIKHKIPYGATYEVPAEHSGGVRFTNQVRT